MWQKANFYFNDLEGVDSLNFKCINCNNHIGNLYVDRMFYISELEIHGLDDFFLNLTCNNCNTSFEINYQWIPDEVYFSYLFDSDDLEEFLHMSLNYYLKKYENDYNDLKNVIDIYQEGLSHRPFIRDYIREYWDSL